MTNAGRRFGTQPAEQHSAGLAATDVPGSGALRRPTSDVKGSTLIGRGAGIMNNNSKRLPVRYGLSWPIAMEVSASALADAAADAAETALHENPTADHLNSDNSLHAALTYGGRISGNF
jgi:hypothetical protein